MTIRVIADDGPASTPPAKGRFAAVGTVLSARYSFLGREVLG